MREKKNNSEKSVSDYQYLIVGGTTKAATTSLFSYLADHPTICAASFKETRFFLDADYPLPSKFRFKNDVEEYNQLFTDCEENQIRLESTPDYLYCSSALERIATFLPNAKMVFSLRDPISRLVSWYRFAVQIGRLPKSLNFDNYAEGLLTDTKQGKVLRDTNHSDLPQYMQALQQGCYSGYLKRYFDIIGERRIYTFFFEELAENPLNVLIDICKFAGIEPDFYSDYTFKVTNRTETMRNSGLHNRYRTLRFKVRKWTHNKPIIHKPLRVMRKAIEPLYLRLNTRSEEAVSISDITRSKLIEYFKPDVDVLSKLIGKRPPWQPFD